MNVSIFDWIFICLNLLSESLILSSYSFSIYILNEYEDEISDPNKKVEASKETITDTHVRNTSVGIVSVKPAALDDATSPLSNDSDSGDG